MRRQEKEEYLAKTSTEIAGKQPEYREFAIIKCEWSVENATKARRIGRKGGIIMKKIPNRLLFFLLKQFNCNLPVESLSGQHMLLYCKESFNVSSIIREFEANNLKHKSLYLFDASGCIDFTSGAKVETRDELLGTILGGIQTPAANLIFTLEQLVEQGLVK
jgi:ribosomal protein L10